MNPPEFPAGGSAPPWSKKEIPLQGPRPPPLKVSKISRKIKKPPVTELASQQQRKPVIIYELPPKVIHISASDFKDVVQRLTGLPPRDEQIAGSGDVSPAARLASIEKTSPTEKERLRNRYDTNHTLRELEEMEMGQFPGILSLAPATLPPIPSEYFSPATDFQTMPFPHELSPLWSGNSSPQTLSFQQELNQFWSGNSFSQTLSFQRELNPFQSENSFPQTQSFQQELNQSWSGNSFPKTLSFKKELSSSWSENSFLQTQSFQQELNHSWSENSPSGLLSGSIVSPIPSPDVSNLFD